MQLLGNVGQRRLPDTPASRRLLYSLSYERSLFERFGRFREDLRVGEDSDFNARLTGSVAIAWAPDVRVAHRNPTRPGALLRDQYRRGRRRAAAHRRAGQPRAARVAASAVLDVVKCLWQAQLTRDPLERRQLLHAWPLLAPAALAYSVGATLGRLGGE